MVKVAVSPTETVSGRPSSDGGCEVHELVGVFGGLEDAGAGGAVAAFLVGHEGAHVDADDAYLGGGGIGEVQDDVAGDLVGAADDAEGLAAEDFVDLVAGFGFFGDDAVEGGVAGGLGGRGRLGGLRLGSGGGWSGSRRSGRGGGSRGRRSGGRRGRGRRQGQLGRGDGLAGFAGAAGEENDEPGDAGDGDAQEDGYCSRPDQTVVHELAHSK